MAQGLHSSQASFVSGCAHSLRICSVHPIRRTTSQARPSLASHVVASQASQNGAEPAAVKPRAPKAKPAAPAPPANQPFINHLRFQVPPPLQKAFESAWRERELDMRGAPGFQGFKMEQDGEQYMVSSSWDTIPNWEAYSLSPAARRSHLPWGIYQRVPDKGEGFPEDFVPFVDFSEAVNAKY